MVSSDVLLKGEKGNDRSESVKRKRFGRDDDPSWRVARELLGYSCSTKGVVEEEGGKRGLRKGSNEGPSPPSSLPVLPQLPSLQAELLSLQYTLSYLSAR